MICSNQLSTYICANLMLKIVDLKKTIWLTKLLTIRLTHCNLVVTGKSVVVVKTQSQYVKYSLLCLSVAKLSAFSLRR